MGGEPLTALNIVGFPAGKLPIDVLTEILRGGQDKVHEAGAVVVGGHSIIDEELKFGLSVTGRVHPKRILSNAHAVVGDRLVLTKPLGTGLLATAAKRGELGTDEAPPVCVDVQAQSRRGSSRARRRRALRHRRDGVRSPRPRVAYRRRRATSRCGSTPRRVPALPGARDAWERGIRTGGAERNAAYLEIARRMGNGASESRTRHAHRSADVGRVARCCARRRRVAEYLSLVPEGVEIGEVIPRQHHGLVLA